MPTLQCPSRQQLSDYVGGVVDESEAESVAAHVDRCTDCQAILETLVRKSDSLLDPLRKMAAGNVQPEPQIEKLVAEAGRYSPGAATATVSPSSSKATFVDMDTFVRELGKSGLLEADEVSELEQSIEADSVQEFALELVRRNKLTRYQAGILARGKSKGLVLGNYVILEKLGQGGMGMVFKARHKRMDRIVALKLLPPSMTKSEEALARFRREVQTAGKLNHTNIVLSHDADEAAGVYFFIMEFVAGSDLARLVKKQGPLPVEQALNCVLQAARGIQYAHQQGIIHRDIKPNNLLLDLEGTIKVLDMGLARLDALHGGNEEADLTGTGTVMGTVDYMSPEQALNAKHADHRADIYSLGCTLYYLLTGKAVFEGETLMEKLIAHREQPVPSLIAARPDIPPAVDSVFRRMMQKKPEQRYQSTDELIEDLEKLASGEDVVIVAPLDSEPATDVWVLDDEPIVNLLPQTPASTIGPLQETLVVPQQPPMLPSPAVSQGIPRRRKPIWTDKRVIIIAAASAASLLIVLIAGLLISSVLNDDDKAARDGESNRGPQNAMANGGNGRVLFVLPHENFWYPDYEGVSQALAEHGVEMVVASSKGKTASPAQTGRPSVNIDEHLENVNVDDFDAVIFCGGNVSEYKEGGFAKGSANRVIHEMKKQGKLVCSICSGCEVLDASGVLDRSTVAYCGDAELKTKDIKFAGHKGRDTSPVVSNYLVTAGHADQSSKFVGTIVTELKKRQKRG